MGKTIDAERIPLNLHEGAALQVRMPVPNSLASPLNLQPSVAGGGEWECRAHGEPRERRGRGTPSSGPGSRPRVVRARGHGLFAFRGFRPTSTFRPNLNLPTCEK
jgi:hypothetical protein